jgi:hypothetical protein
MPHRFRALLLCAALATSTTTAAADAAADFATLQELHAARWTDAARRGSPEHMNWLGERSRRLRELGTDFLATHANDPRRWDVLVMLQHSGDQRTATRNTDGNLLPSPARDTALWQQRYFSMLEDLLEAPDASRSARHAALLQLIDHHTNSVRRGTVDNPRKGLVPALTLWVREFHALDPNSGYLAYLYLRVARMLDALDPAQGRAFLAEKRLLHQGSHHPDTDVRRNLDNFERLVRNQDQPATELWQYLQRLDATFTTLGHYQGKVVLVANVPVDSKVHTAELERLYQKYRDGGFDLIHVVSQNRSKTAPAVQTERTAMEAFVREKKWPWRVIWDSNPGMRRFHDDWAQNSIPAFLLVGRDGRVAREVPGEVTLDQRVRRALLASPERDALPLVDDLLKK